MRPRRALAIAAIALVVTVAASSAAMATHAPSAADVIAADEASPWLQVCTASATQADCVEPDGSNTPTRHAVIKPATGPLASVVTTAEGVLSRTGWFMQTGDDGWMTALHQVGCANLAGVQAYLVLVASLRQPGPVPSQTVGE